MAILTTTRLYQTGELLLDTDFNIFLDDIELFLNSTKVNDDNIQDQGVNAALKLANATISNNKISDLSVTADKVADTTVTAAQLTSNSITESKLADSGIATTDILDEALTTAKIAADVVPSIRPLAVASFTTAGSHSWTVPANIFQIIVEGCGGGGGGGGGGGSADWNSGFAPPIGSPKPAIGGGGGGSSYIRSKRVNVTPGQILAIYVGPGGSAGAGGFASSNVNLTAASPGVTLGGNGASGQDSTVSIAGGATLATFPGGTGGAGGRAFAWGYDGVPSASGGTYEASGGGAPVEIITNLIIRGGAGGDTVSCGTAEDGAPIYSITGIAGQTAGGDAPGGSGGNLIKTGTPGQGGGGGGGAGWRNTSEANGGQGANGAPGIVKIWY